MGCCVCNKKTIKEDDKLMQQAQQQFKEAIEKKSQIKSNRMLDYEEQDSVQEQDKVKSNQSLESKQSSEKSNEKSAPAKSLKNDSIKIEEPPAEEIENKKQKKDEDDSLSDEHDDSEEELHDPASVIPPKCKNNFKKTNYNCHITNIQINKITSQSSVSYYKITFVVSYMSMKYEVTVDGILSSNLQKNFMSLKGDEYFMRKHTSLIRGFFQEDRYFNAIRTDKKIPYTSLTPQPYLIYVERSMNSGDKVGTKDKFKRSQSVYISKDQSSTPGMASQFTEQQNSTTQQRPAKLNDVLEVMVLYDVEFQQNFKNLLITKIIQDENHGMREDAIQINYLLMIFSEEPTLDLPAINHLCIFYKQIDYTLNQLRHLCWRECFVIEEDLILVLFKNLAQTLVHFYERNFYRLNINLDTVYYSFEDHSFRINYFNRIKNLNSLKIEKQRIMNDSKLTKRFVRAFQKDMSAVVDITLYFLVLRMRLPVSWPQLSKFSIDRKTDMIQHLRLRYEQIKPFFMLSMQQGICSFEDVQSQIIRIKELITQIEPLVDFKKVIDAPDFVYGDEERHERTKTRKQGDGKGGTQKIEGPSKKSQSKSRRSKQSGSNSDSDSSSSSGSSSENSSDKKKSQSDAQQSVQHSSPIKKEGPKSVKDESVSKSSQQSQANSDSENSRSQNDEMDEKLQLKPSEVLSIMQLSTFNIRFEEVFDGNKVCYAKNRESFNEQEKDYQLFYLQVLLMRGNYTVGRLEQLYNTILSTYKKLSNSDKKNEIYASKLCMIYAIYEQLIPLFFLKEVDRKQAINKLLNDFIQVIRRIPFTVQEPIFFGALVKGLELMKKYQMVDLLSRLIPKFRAATNRQKKLKRELMQVPRYKRKQTLCHNDRWRGIIQVRKAIIHNIFSAEKSLLLNQPKDALTFVQQLMKLQEDPKLEKGILLAYTTILNGLIAFGDLQYTTAMLNFNIADGLYNDFYGENHYTLSIIGLQLGKVYICTKDYEHASKFLQNSFRVLQMYQPPTHPDIIRILLELLKIYVELEESGLALEVCMNYKSYTSNRQLLSKQISAEFGQFLVVMGKILQAQGSLLSAITIYTRAIFIYQKCGISAHFQIFLLQQQIKGCLTRVYQNAIIANGFVGKKRNWIYQEPGFIYLKDMIGLSLLNSNQTYSQNKAPSFVELHPSKISTSITLSLATINFKDYDEAFNNIKEQVMQLKQSKRTHVYGLLAMKMAQIVSQTTEDFEKVILYCKIAIDQFPRYLNTPIREMSMLRCIVMLIYSYFKKDSKYDYMDQIEEGMKVIDEFETRWTWQRGTISRKYLLPSDKFLVHAQQKGMKSAVQLFEFVEYSKLFKHFRNKLITAIKLNEPLDEIITTYHKKLMKSGSVFTRTVQKVRNSLCKWELGSVRLKPPPENSNGGRITSYLLTLTDKDEPRPENLDQIEPFKPAQRPTKKKINDNPIITLDNFITVKPRTGNLNGSVIANLQAQFTQSQIIKPETKQKKDSRSSVQKQLNSAEKPQPKPSTEKKSLPKSNEKPPMVESFIVTSNTQDKRISPMKKQSLLKNTSATPKKSVQWSVPPQK